MSLALPVSVHPPRQTFKGSAPHTGLAGAVFEVPSLDAPKPGRPERHLLARCFIVLFGAGESRSLFDVMAALLRAASDDPSKFVSGPNLGSVYKGPFDKTGRAAAFYILGELFVALGHNVLSLFNEVVSVAQVVGKNTSHPTTLRYQALLCLNKLLKASGNMGDSLGKEILRHSRQGLADKAGPIVRANAECLTVVTRNTGLLHSRSEVESVLALALKALESADYPTKRSLVELSAALLATTQQDVVPVAVHRKLKKKKEESAGGSSDTEDLGISGSGGTGNDGQFRKIMDPVAMLEQISGAFWRPTSTRALQCALLDVYAALFAELGTEWVNVNYELLIAHLLETLPAHLKSSHLDRHDSQFVRRGVNIILRQLIGERMLGEQGQVAAITTISNQYLAKFPALTPSARAPDEMALLMGLDEVAGLLEQLGNASSQVYEVLYDPVLRNLNHPSNAVQTAAARVLQIYCDVVPGHLKRAIEQLQDNLTRDIHNLIAHAQNSHSLQVIELSRRATGRARALAALVALIPKRPLYVDGFQVSGELIAIAIDRLKQAGNHDLHVSAVEIQVAWTMLTGLMALGPQYVSGHLGTLLGLWKNALPQTTTRTLPAGLPGGGTAGARSEAEWAFLLHVRECALTCILAFVLHNGPLLTSSSRADVPRRIVPLLSNMLQFLDAFHVTHPHLITEQTQVVLQGQQGSTTTLLDRAFFARRRLFQILASLTDAGPTAGAALEGIEVDLLMQCVSDLSEPDKYVGSSALAAIAASAGNFTSIWDVHDGYAFGLTSLVDNDGNVSLASLARLFPSGSPVAGDGDTLSSGGYSDAGTELSSGQTRLNRTLLEDEVDQLQHQPIFHAYENDFAHLALFPPSPVLPRDGSNRGAMSTVSQAIQSYAALSVSDPYPATPVPALTAVVDLAIVLFSRLYATQSANVQQMATERLLGNVLSPKLDKNPGRRLAVRLNVLAAIGGALRSIVALTGGRPAPSLRTEPLMSLLRDLLRTCLLTPERALQKVTAEAYGRLAVAVGGLAHFSPQVQFLVDQVISNRDPAVRAGCALAFGQIYSGLGALNANPVMKTVVNMLMSLAADPHPVVHYHALTSLRMVIENASLSYTPYVASTLGMLARLYMQDTHEAEGGSVGSVNMRGNLPAQQAMVQIINTLVGTLGPELADSPRIRQLVLILLHELAADPQGEVHTDASTAVEVTRAYAHFNLFAPAFIDQADWIRVLRTHLTALHAPRVLKVAAMTALYQLVQKDALVVSKVGGDRLAEDFFSQLDFDPGLDGVREVTRNWLRQTAPVNPRAWVDLCQRIISGAPKSAAVPPPAGGGKPKASELAAAELQDEEVASLGIESSSSFDTQNCRWRTKLFALECVHEVFDVLRSTNRLEHFTAPPHSSNQHGSASLRSQFLLSSRIGDLIKMAFSASTDGNTGIRLAGLVVLGDVIDNFKDTPDPDFDESLDEADGKMVILEQHQAPIAAALMPAFAGPSGAAAPSPAPDVVSSAIQVCATYVGSGIVRQVGQMGRILKQLVASLHDVFESADDTEEDANPGEASATQVVKASTFAPSAHAMIKIAVLKAWAQLYLASQRQLYLVKIVRPQLEPVLVPHWVAVLTEYARMHNTSEDELAWEQPLQVKPVCAGDKAPLRQATLDRVVMQPLYQAAWAELLETLAVLMGSAADRDVLDKVFPTEQGKSNTTVMLFWPLYGLAFEVLAAPQLGQDALREATEKRVALHTLQQLTLHNHWSGAALTGDARVLQELVQLVLRMAATETSTSVQNAVLELLACALGLFGTQRNEGDSWSDAMSANKDLVSDAALRASILAIQSARARLGAGSVDEQVALINRGYRVALAIVRLTSNLAEKANLLAMLLHLYSEQLRDETTVVDAISGTLPSLKLICDAIPSSLDMGSGPRETIHQALHGITSQCVTTLSAMRSRDPVLATLLVRGNFLAITLLLTTSSPSWSFGRTVLEEFWYELFFRFSTAPATGTLPASASDEERSAQQMAVAGQTCILSLVKAVAAGAETSTAVRYCVGHLMAAMVAHIVSSASALGRLNLASRTEMTADVEKVFVVVGEEIQILIAPLDAWPADTRMSPCVTPLSTPIRKLTD